MVNFFAFLKLNFFCFVVAICDLVHYVEAIFANSFTDIAHISDKNTRCFSQLTKVMYSLRIMH